MTATEKTVRVIPTREDLAQARVRDRGDETARAQAGRHVRRPRADGAPLTAPLIDEALVHRLIGAQFPQWAHLPIAAVSSQGWDNRSFRLGGDRVIRLPSAEAYAAQVKKEQRWLPFLAPKLPVPIPTLLARGAPGEGYPWRWSIYRWIDGEPANLEIDSAVFANDVAAFLIALQEIDATGGPAPGRDNFHRGGRLATYDAEVREALARIDVPGAPQAWEAALASEWQARPVWVHGDVALGNLLRRGDRLRGVIDFGQLAVGDPACDLAIGWSVFHGDSRKAFRERLGVDDDTWARARGWALWKALIVAAGMASTNAAEWADPWRALTDILEA